MPSMWSISDCHLIPITNQPKKVEFGYFTADEFQLSEAFEKICEKLPEILLERNLKFKSNELCKNANNGEGPKISRSLKNTSSLILVSNYS